MVPRIEPARRSKAAHFLGAQGRGLSVFGALRDMESSRWINRAAVRMFERCEGIAYDCEAKPGGGASRPFASAARREDEFSAQAWINAADLDSVSADEP